MRLRPGRIYTRTQLQQFIDENERKALELQGYVLRHDVLSDTYQIVHWTHASGAESFGPASSQPTQTGLRAPRIAHDPFAFDEVPKIVKRTPQERVDSMMARLLEDCLRTGTVPHVSDDRISAILGFTKDTSRDGITAEEVQTIVSHLLTDAENKKKVADFKKVADYSPTT